MLDLEKCSELNSSYGDTSGVRESRKMFIADKVSYAFVQGIQEG